MRNAILFVAALLALAPAATRAEAPADTTFDAYVRGLSDSTDAYFGDLALPADTTGLDSTLSAMLADPNAAPRGRGSSLEFGPWVRWNRGDGPVSGAAATLGWPRRTGELAGRLAWAHGARDLLGRGEYRKRWGDAGPEDAWDFAVGGGRETRAFDRDHWDPYYATLSAALAGADRHDYARFDGWSASLSRRLPAWRAALTWRDEGESPRPVTATWTLTGARAERRDMAVARRGRARELQWDAGARLRRLPLTLDLSYATSGRQTGSDFTYRRTRLSAAGDFSIGRRIAVVPQVEYGRLRGEAVPQAAFFLGGRSSIRTMDRNALRGTGKALAQLDVILTDDVLERLGIPHPAALPLQVGAFAATGAVWGRTHDGTLEPNRDAAAPTSRDWAERRDWLTEAGISVMWRPGLPDPNFYWRFDHTWPIGADARRPRLTFGVTKLFDLVRATGD